MMSLLLLILFSCKKSPETIGNNLISDNNFIGVLRTDTTSIVCHSYRDDSIGTKNVTSALLGSMKDPVFGTTEAGFYTQFRPSLAGQSFGDNPVLDSLALQLCISGYYGDTAALQTVRVYELADTLSSSESYYGYSEVEVNTVDHANGYPFRPRPKTKIHIIGNDTIKQAIVRIPLSQELGNYLLSLDTVAYSQPTYFKQYFKGLYLICDPIGQDGAITYFNLTNNAVTALQLYYHDASSPENVMRYDYYITSSDVYFNHFDHDYNQGSPEFVNQLEGQYSLGDSVIYLQTMGGVRAFIQFPNLTHWADSLDGSYIVVNEAKLVLPVSSLDSSCYTIPTKLVLVGLNADNSTYILPDYYEGSDYFDGNYSSTKQSVSFRITEYVQSLIMGKNDNVGISLGINGASYNAHRLVIRGPKVSEGEKMRLEVTYSIVNE